MIVEPYWVLSQIENVFQNFAPDAIFTVPDNTLSWSAYLLAQKTGLPLITNFQDWWPRGQFTLSLEKPYLPTRLLLEQRFYKLYQSSHLAFCTSAGMRQKLGNHPNAPVLYPCPAPRNPEFQPSFQVFNSQNDRPFRIIYAGTTVNAYGRSILSLAKALQEVKGFEFHVYGPPPDWSSDDLTWMTREGIYRGLLPYEELKSKLSEADACLVVMSFEPQLRIMMETSFTTKFLEYSQFGKPIIVWGPDYCQPVRVANAEASALTVTTPDPSAVIEAINLLLQPNRWLKLAHGAWNAAVTSFDYHQIHKGFRDSIYSLLEVS
jgi:glycosyltransferase involved in cell wall biosynthesis